MVVADDASVVVIGPDRDDRIVREGAGVCDVVAERVCVLLWERSSESVCGTVSLAVAEWHPSGTTRELMLL